MSLTSLKRDGQDASQRRNKTKKFFLILPSHPHQNTHNPLFIGITDGEGKCEDRWCTLTTIRM